MSKILFVTSGMTHGGVNKSLLNMVNLLDKQKYNIDIFSIYQQGPYQKLFKNVHIIPVKDILHTFYPFHIFLQFRPFRKNCEYRTFDLLTKIAIHLFPIRYAKRIGQILSPRSYDVIVSFQEGYTTELATYIKAPKHFAWIHCDYSRYIAEMKKDESDIYQKYNNIIAVSAYTAGIVRKHMPTVANKVMTIHNPMDQNEIVELSQAYIDDKCFSIAPFMLISIGRMDSVKRFSMIPRMARKLKENSIPFRWYIVGDGGMEKAKVEKAIIDNHVKSEVVLLGAKDNPYPYIKHSSVLVCPSLSEACPNVVNEGRILHIPVITADFPSAKEFIISGITGFISPIEEIPNLLIHLYRNEDDYKSVLDNIKDYKYDNNKILMKIENLLS